MAITYEQIKREIQCVSEEVVNSNNEIPSLLSTVRYGVIPAAIYFFFYFCCCFTDVFIKNIWLFVGFLSFFFWVFISLFISGYSQVLSMLPKDAQDRFEIVRICQNKMRVYYAGWLFSIALAGVLSLVTIWNAIALAAVTALSTILIALAFNFDISRYQLASLFGAIGALKAGLNK
ncbi:hypothetical protein [Mixta calida]|uniref:hypothetical protein n=1 Tax=Mixta calida TaxID=665913 RepID=UPI002FDE5240